MGVVETGWRAWLGGVWLVAALMLAPGAHAADDARAQAVAHFERGIAYFHDGAWERALAEFLRSRALYPTRGNTHNAALCLDRLERHAEALEMLEALVGEFPDVPDRAALEEQIRRLRSLTGTIELRAPRGVSVVIDGRERGTTPLGAVRVDAGSHVVRAFRPGASPFEERVEVAGGEEVVIDADLPLLTRSGRLRVSEREGRAAEVLIDGVVVGRAPWEGELTPGAHAVALRAAAPLGTQPARAPVALGETTAITLALEPLECELRIDPEPITATVALDGVELGRGSWAGPVRCGDHRVELAAEGFLPARRSLVVRRSLVAEVELERDPDSPLGRRASPARITVEAAAGPLVAPSFFGDAASCGEGCSAIPPFGVSALLRGGYQFGSGVGLSLDLGFSWLRGTIDERAVTLRAVPSGSELSGSASDRLTLWGLSAGVSGSLQRGDDWPWTVRLGAGVSLGAMDDRRSAVVRFAGGPGRYGPAEHRRAAHFFYIAPELLIARRLGKLELGAGLRPTVLAALIRPELELTDQPTDAAAGGLFAFERESLAGTVIFVASGIVSARWGFH